MSRVESSGLPGVHSWGDLQGSCSQSLGSEASQRSQDDESMESEPEGTPALDIPYTRRAGRLRGGALASPLGIRLHWAPCAPKGLAHAPIPIGGRAERVCAAPLPRQPFVRVTR
jgi:hypothetical protein